MLRFKDSYSKPGVSRLTFCTTGQPSLLLASLPVHTISVIFNASPLRSYLQRTALEKWDVIQNIWFYCFISSPQTPSSSVMIVIACQIKGLYMLGKRPVGSSLTYVITILVRDRKISAGIRAT